MSKKPWFHTFCCALIAAAGTFLLVFTGPFPLGVQVALVVVMAGLLAGAMWMTWAFDQYREAAEDYIAYLEDPAGLTAWQKERGE